MADLQDFDTFNLRPVLEQIQVVIFDCFRVDPELCRAVMHLLEPFVKDGLRNPAFWSTQDIDELY